MPHPAWHRMREWKQQRLIGKETDCVDVGAFQLEVQSAYTLTCRGYTDNALVMFLSGLYKPFTYGSVTIQKFTLFVYAMKHWKNWWLDCSCLRASLRISLWSQRQKNLTLLYKTSSLSALKMGHNMTKKWKKSSQQKNKMLVHNSPEREYLFFKAIGNIHQIPSIPSLLCLTVLSHTLPLTFHHLIFSSTHSLPTISKLGGSILVMVPEGALTLPSLSCSSSSCGAAEGDTKGSLHLRGQPTSSWDSKIKTLQVR